MLFSEDVGFGNQVYNKLKKTNRYKPISKGEEYLNDERYDSLLWILTEPNKNHFPFMFFRLHLKISRVVRFGQDVEILLEEMWRQVLKLDNDFCKQAQTIAWYKHKILEHFNQEIEKPHFYLRALICDYKYNLIKCSRNIRQSLEKKVFMCFAELFFISYESKQNSHISKVTNLLTRVDTSRILLLTSMLHRMNNNYVDHNNYVKYLPSGNYSSNKFFLFQELDFMQNNMQKEDVRNWKTIIRQLKKDIKNKTCFELDSPSFCSPR